MMLWNGRRDAWASTRVSTGVDLRRYRMPYEGLPPLATGSRWEGDQVKNVVESARITSNGGRYVVAFHLCGRMISMWLADVRHLIASHDRANGCYWADEVRSLEAWLRRQSHTLAEYSQRSVGLHEAADAVHRLHEAADAVHRLLANLREKGVC